jgi:spermidine synthase
LICVSGLAAIVALFPFSKRLNEPDLLGIESESQGSRRRNLFAAATILCLATLLALSVPRLPWEVIAYGRYLPTKIDFGTILCVGEGMNASIAVTEMKNGVRNFHVSGKIEASSHPRDMHLQRMLGHLPGLFHPKPRSVLVVGCGAGVTAGSFILYPDVQQVVICEIEPLIPTVVAEYFAKENYNVMHDPRVKVIYDDARHYILTTTNTFDIITSDPIHPWVKGAATLYTKEYFQLCKRRLNPGGFVTQWVPLYESSEAAVKSEVATFFSAFPSGTIWSNDENGEGYDVVLLGQKEAEPIHVDEICDRLKQPEYADVLQSLREMGCQSAIGLLATYGGWAPDLTEWLENAELNRDGNLRLQYLAGMGLNALEEEFIYSELLQYRRFPKELFAGSPERRRSLQMIFERPSKTERK